MRLLTLFLSAFTAVLLLCTPASSDEIGWNRFYMGQEGAHTTKEEVLAYLKSDTSIPSRSWLGWRLSPLELERQIERALSQSGHSGVGVLTAVSESVVECIVWDKGDMEIVRAKRHDGVLRLGTHTRGSYGECENVLTYDGIPLLSLVCGNTLIGSYQSPPEPVAIIAPEPVVEDDDYVVTLISGIAYKSDSTCYSCPRPQRQHYSGGYYSTVPYGESRRFRRRDKKVVHYVDRYVPPPPAPLPTGGPVPSAPPPTGGPVPSASPPYHPPTGGGGPAYVAPPHNGGGSAGPVPAAGPAAAGAPGGGPTGVGG